MKFFVNFFCFFLIAFCFLKAQQDDSAVFDYAATEARKASYESNINIITQKINKKQSSIKSSEAERDKLLKKQEKAIELRDKAVSQLEIIKIKLRTVLSKTSEFLEEQKKLRQRKNKLDQKISVYGSQIFVHEFDIEKRQKEIENLKKKKKVYQKNLDKSKQVLKEAGDQKNEAQTVLTTASRLSSEIDAFFTEDDSEKKKEK